MSAAAFIPYRIQLRSIRKVKGCREIMTAFFAYGGGKPDPIIHHDNRDNKSSAMDIILFCKSSFRFC